MKHITDDIRTAMLGMLRVRLQDGKADTVSELCYGLTAVAVTLLKERDASRMLAAFLFELCRSDRELACAAIDDVAAKRTIN